MIRETSMRLLTVHGSSLLFLVGVPFEKRGVGVKFWFILKPGS